MLLPITNNVTITYIYVLYRNVYNAHCSNCLGSVTVDKAPAPTCCMRLLDKEVSSADDIRQKDEYIFYFLTQTDIQAWIVDLISGSCGNVDNLNDKKFKGRTLAAIFGLVFVYCP